MPATWTATVMAPGSPTRTITAAAGPRLGTDAPRHRPVGRIGGMTGVHDHAAAAALGARLGPGAQVLPDRHDGRLHVTADWDACWINREPVRSLEDWRAIVAAGTLADVDGAFAVAWLDADGTLWLARDAIGERTLYYAQRDRAVVFASTLHAVLATGLVERSVNPAALGAYLAYRSEERRVGKECRL